MMPLGIGMLELIMLGLTATAVCVMYFSRLRFRHWSVVLLGCAALASLLTPADLFSMLVMTLVFVCVYYAGTRHQSVHTPVAASIATREQSNAPQPRAVHVGNQDLICHHGAVLRANRSTKKAKWNTHD